MAGSARQRLEALKDHWASLCPTRDGLPSRHRLDPVALKPWLGNLLVVDLTRGCADFRYRLFGSIAAIQSGIDRTGKGIDCFPPHHREIVHHGYRTAAETRRPWFTCHIMAFEGERHAAWERVVLPLADEPATVSHLLVGLYRVPVDDVAAYRRQAEAAFDEVNETSESIPAPA